MGSASGLIRLLGVCTGVLALTVGPAAAADDPFANAQKAATYTVYQPQVTLGMVRSAGSGGFQSYPCSKPGGPGFTAAYVGGSKGAGFSLSESASGCLDGPDGVGQYGTVRIGSSTATIMGSCAAQKPTCGSATATDVKRNAYTTVTLPAAKGHGRTFVELYSNGLGPRAIAQILRGLKPVATH